MKKTNLMKLGIVGVLFLALSFVGCNDDNDNQPVIVKKYGIFTVSDNGLSATVKGGIVDATLTDFTNMIAKFPNIKTLNLVDVPGSNVSGDKQTDKALELGREVYKKNINTHLVDNGFVASGGTDLLACGKKVSVGTNPKIGVHSWSGGLDGNPNGSAWDIKDDENHIEHKKYLRYFEDVGFTTQKAKEFYFFTIRSAKPEEVHYMTTVEINKYLIR